MSGLLDFLRNGTGDPERDAALNRGLLTAGLSLLGARGRTAPALGQAGLLGLQGADQYQQQAFQRKVQQHQLGQMEREKMLQGLPAQFYQQPMKPPTMDNRDVGQPGEQPVGAGTFDFPGYSTALAKYNPAAALQMQAALAPPKPTVSKPGDIARDAQGKVVWQNPAEADKEPEDIRALKLIYGDGTPEYKAALARLGQKKTTHQPAASMNVQVSTAKTFGNTLAEKLGGQLDAGLADAKSAQGSIRTAHNIRQAIDSGKVMAGPGTSFRVLGIQLGQVLGVGGKDSAKVLANTRTAIRSMAQAELDAAPQIKGQGQITQPERELLRKAASGDIDSLTVVELRQLSGVMERTGRIRIQNHKGNVANLKNMKDKESQQAVNAMLPFYEIEEPPAYAPPGAAPLGIDPAAIDAELKRRGGR